MNGDRVGQVGVAQHRARIAELRDRDVGAPRPELRDVRVFPAGKGEAGRETARERPHGHVRAARCIHRDHPLVLVAGTAKVREVEELVARGAELRGVRAGAAPSADGWLRRGIESEVRRQAARRLSRDVGVARVVEGDAKGVVEAWAAEVGQVEDRRSGRIELEDETVEVAAGCRLDGAHRGQIG